MLPPKNGKGPLPPRVRREGSAETLAARDAAPELREPELRGPAPRGAGAGGGRQGVADPRLLPLRGTGGRRRGRSERYSFSPLST